MQNIVRAVMSHAVDGLLVAEAAYKTSSHLLVQVLNDVPHDAEESKFAFVAASAEARVQIYSRLNSPQWQVKVSRSYYDI